MEAVTIEKADYLITYYDNLLPLNEKNALKHHRSTIKVNNAKDVRLTRMYLKTGWLSDDPMILNYQSDGYI